MSDEIKKTIQPWIVSLSISVFCCAIFFAMMSNYVGKLNATLDKIDGRLAAIEARAAAPAPLHLTVQPPIMPSVQIPSVDSQSSGSGVPSAAPAPESVAPVLPSVPPSAAPINDGESNKQ